MSILKKPYEISVWDDVWETNKFVEKRLGIIGTDNMISQSRAIEPNLTRDVNGQKKFSFKMYRYYIDNETGERIENEFSSWLISERKIKLKYGKDEEGNDIWHTFFIKDINENSSTYLYTYQLEDAIMVELSRNGYGVTLDASLNNNIGNARELAEYVLKDTDWQVESETLVEKVEEALVYLTTSVPLSVFQLIDPINNGGVTQQSKTIPARSTVLAFYSCCTGKPHRFQFLYFGEKIPYSKNNDGKFPLSRQDDRVVVESNCQYYIDSPIYGEKEDTYGFCLPNSFAILNLNGENSDTTISSWYRGHRYGYAPQSKYISLLDRYVNCYNKEGANYYVYPETEYTSTKIIQNFVSNADFKSTAGWVGTHNSSNKLPSSNRAQIEQVYGRFGKLTAEDENTIFISSIDDLENDQFEENVNNYRSYLKVTFPIGDSVVVNSGPFDNRTIISNMEFGSEWLLDFEFLDAKGDKITSNLPTIELSEAIYNDKTDGYSITNDRIIFSKSGNIWKVSETQFNPKTFKRDSKVKIIIKPSAALINKTIYISSANFYRVVRDEENNIITPENFSLEGVKNTTYHYFLPTALNNLTSKEELSTSTTQSLSDFTPVYNVGAEKIRTVQAKESNYFNILSSIAEKFEAWIDYVITIDDDGNTIKTVKFKNYRGKEKYAGIKYGVNLKDIVRTYASKNITTKLIVKDNKNQLAENGFCSIARAAANPSGENYIYDFSYYQNKGLLSATDYLLTLYSLDDADGPDGSGHLSFSINNHDSASGSRIIGVPLSSISMATDESGKVKIVSTFLPKEELKGNIVVSEEDAKGIDYVTYSGGAFTMRLKDTITKTIYATAWPFKDDDSVACSLEFEFDGSTSASCSIVPQQEPHTNRLETDTYVHTASNFTYKILDLSASDFNLNGYFPRVKNLNNKYLELSDQMASYRTTLTKEKAAYEVEKATYEAALSELEEINWEFETLTGVKPDQIGSKFIQEVEIVEDGISYNEELLEGVEVTFGPDVTTATVKGTFKGSTSTAQVNIIFGLKINLNPIEDAVEKLEDTGTETNKEYELTRFYSVTLTNDKPSQTIEITTVDREANTIRNLLEQYATQTNALAQAQRKANDLQIVVDNLTAKISELQLLMDIYLRFKKALNQLFYKRYYRFIQEGTWISEDYVDNNKYYNDAQSVLYNSCYPQVAYNFNVLSLSGLEGYEEFELELGDRTFVEDPDFFEDNHKEPIVLTQITEYLDEPDKNVVKFQNFKNQFQDLFQKITATVQQAQYSTGAYEKAVALAEGTEQIKNNFLQEAINAAEAKLAIAGQQSVISDETGITITDLKTPSNQIRMVGGAILLSKNDKNGEQKWVTGLTNDGISASLVTTGLLNTGAIQIMNGNDPTFRWDSYGISAFDYQDNNNILSKYNSKKFVRFDKHGLYGINGAADGLSWKPESLAEIDKIATFGLTWEGLKVTNKNGITLRIGDNAKTDQNNTNLLDVRNGSGNSIISITENGSLIWGPGSAPIKVLYARNQLQTPTQPWLEYDEYTNEEIDNWHRVKAEDDFFASYSYDGGTTWDLPVQIQGQDGVSGATCYIESNVGQLIEENETGEAILTAIIIEHNKTIEPEGLTYTWYVNNNKVENEINYQLKIDLKQIKNKSVRFTAIKKA